MSNPVSWGKIEYHQFAEYTQRGVNVKGFSHRDLIHYSVTFFYGILGIHVKLNEKERKKERQKEI